MTSTLAVLASALALASSAPPQTLSVDPSATVVRFHVNHKMHKVDGRSTAVEGKAVIEPGGRVLAMVRIPVSSFDSGDANRDSHMRETLDAGKHPFVVFKGVSSMLVPAAFGKAVPMTLQGELDFHGVTRPVAVPVSVEFDPDGSALITGRMKVSLEAHRVERPSLLFVKVDDECTIEFSLKMRRAG